MSHSPASEPRPRRRFSWPLAFVFAVLIGAALAAFLAYRAETVARSTASEVADAFAKVLQVQPRISVRDRVIVEQAAPVLELATVTREVEVERETVETYLGSTKRLKVRGVYRVRAGYNLREPFEVNLAPGTIQVSLPPAVALGADQVTVEVLDQANGFWNKVQAEDVAALARLLPAQAQQKAVAAGLLDDATKAVRDQLQEKLKPLGTVEVTTTEKALALP